MSTTSINKADWVGTKADYIALSAIESNKKYYITDLETFAINNSAMASALTTYHDLYSIGDVFLCVDSGTYSQNTFYKFNSTSWIELGSLVTSSEKNTWNGKSDFSGNYNDLTNKLTAGTGININASNVISSTGEIPFIEVVGSAETYTYVDEDTQQSTTVQLLVFDLNDTNWNKLVNNGYSQFKLDYTIADVSTEDVYTDYYGFLITHNYSSSWTAEELMMNSINGIYNGNEGSPIIEPEEFRQFQSTDLGYLISDMQWCFTGTIKTITTGNTVVKHLYMTSQNLKPLYNMIGDIETLLGGI